MSRILLITNPVAARAKPRVVRAIQRVFADAGWDVDVAGTTQPGHAAELARQGVEDGADVIGVCAGDGTTMQAVRGFIGSDVPLALLPLGTGNILARNLRIPRNPVAAARLVLAGRTRPVDLGVMHANGGAAYFGVACGAGFDAEVMARTSREAKRRFKTLAYTATAFRLHDMIRPSPCRLTVDGRVFEGEASTVLVANCVELFPPYYPIAEDARLDDGLLDVVAMRGRGLLDALGILARRGATGRWDDRVTHLRGVSVRVETDPATAAQHDGESAGVTPFDAEVHPGAIRIFVEAGS